jgi:hypothetical protein
MHVEREHRHRDTNEEVRYKHRRDDRKQRSRNESGRPKSRMLITNCCLLADD